MHRTCHLEYAFLEGDDKLPVIIAKDLKDEEKAALLKVLKSHKRAIAWKLSDIKGVSPEFCTHKILMEEDYEPSVQRPKCLERQAGNNTTVTSMFSGLLSQIPTDPKDQEKTTFTCPNENFSLIVRMPFGPMQMLRALPKIICAIFHDTELKQL
ncbi:hypothetical protein Tco_0576623 [Tanacetum coccineum]